VFSVATLLGDSSTTKVDRSLAEWTICLEGPDRSAVDPSCRPLEDLEDVCQFRRPNLTLGIRVLELNQIDQSGGTADEVLSIVFNVDEVRVDVSRPDASSLE
jgi:hypothetical protein